MFVPHHVRSRLATAMLLCLLAAGNAIASSPPRSAADPTASAAGLARPIDHGQRVFTCAHSFHVFVYRMVREMAVDAGIEGHELAGLSRIGGSRVIQHWDVADEQNAVKAALRAGKVDVLTLSPIWLPDEGIDRFASLGLAHNPQLRVTVQEFWLPNDTYDNVYPTDIRRQVDHDATDLDRLEQEQDRYRRDLAEYVQGVNRRLGANALLLVPVGKAVVALRKKIVAHQAPGLNAQSDLFRDSVGHAQPPLCVLSAYCHFAVIYRRSPIGMPMARDLAKANNPKWDARLSRLLQELAWDAVTHEPLSGLAASPPPQ